MGMRAAVHGSESFVLPAAFWKCKDSNIKNM